MSRKDKTPRSVPKTNGLHANSMPPGSISERTVHMTRPPSMPEAPKKPKIMIGVPCYGGNILLPCANGLINLCLSLHSSGIPFVKHFLGNESLVTRARNRIANDFLESDCSHLLFIDADVGFRPDDAAVMVRGDWDVCVGAYPMKTMCWEAVHKAVVDGHPAAHLAELGALYAVNPTTETLAGDGQVKVYEKNGGSFVEVMDGATGFMLIRRNVLERMRDEHRDELAYLADYDPCHGKTHFMFFQAERDPVAIAAHQPARYLSEDYAFCRRWQSMGGRVYLSIKSQLTHTGTWTFEGDVGRLFTEHPPARAAETHAVAVEMVAPAT